jgi:predicted Zn-dependent protease
MSPQETVERALALSKADGCIVLANERSEANLRWANNTLTTNGSMRSRRLAVISVVDGQAGTAAGVVERSAVTDETIEDLVRASEQAARDAGPAEDAAPLVEPSDAGGDWSAGPEETSIGVFSSLAPALGEAFGRAAGEQRLLFGFAEHALETRYLGTSTGVRLRHAQPTGSIEVNGKSPDFARSAYVGQATVDFTDVDVAALDGELARRLGWVQRTVELPAGRYETLLPPTAVADLMFYLYLSSGARDADEGRTVFSKAGGGTRVGEKLSDLPLSLRSDPHRAGLQAEPFLTATSTFGGLISIFDNGHPLRSTEWIKDGKLNELIRSRSWAEKSGAQPAPIIDNLIMESEGATASLEDMIARTERGLLVTSLWYIREVDPQVLLLTGLTRDGVYLVENGEVTGAVNNYRWNESPVDLLGRISETSRAERCLPREWNDYFNRTVMPSLRIPDFNMSTVSQAS